MLDAENPPETHIGSSFGIESNASKAAEPMGDFFEVADMEEKSVQAQPTVLVADDEEIIVTVTTKMLERSGARVLSASDGLEAVRQYERHKEEISVVFLDLEMPRLNGVETFRRLKMLRPDVRVVIMSGYVTPANRLLLDSLCPLGYIEKPMRINDFLPYLTNHQVQQNDTIAQDA